MADDLPLLDNDGADHWIWACRSPALHRQAERRCHEVEILLSTGHRFLRRVVEDLRAGLADRDFFTGTAADTLMAACAAANRAIATRNGEQLT